MEDALEVYHRPYNPKRPVICLDELCKQLIGETRIPIPVAAGRIGKYDTEYTRNGTANIFLAIEPLQGRFITQVTNQRTKIDFAPFIKTLVDEHYPDAEQIVVVMDNLNTHNGSSLYETFEPVEARRLLDKLEIHYTPKHGSWLNIAEIGLSILGRQCLKRRIADQDTLDREVTAWTNHRNANPISINWQFAAKDARLKLRRLYPSLVG
jgi:transposase